MTIPNDVQQDTTSSRPTLRGRRKYPFAQVPHWVLGSGVSSGAIHLFCLMAQKADAHSGEQYASQKTFAGLMQVSERTVRSYFAELKAIRAADVVRRRWNNSSVTVVALDAPLEEAEAEELVNDSQEADFLTSQEADSRKSGSELPPNKNQTQEPDIKNQIEVIASPKRKEEPQPLTFTEMTITSSVPALKKARPRDELWEALMEACSVDVSRLTKSARGAANTATQQLREVGATPDDIHRGAMAYRLAMPQALLTPTALAKHWPALRGYLEQPKLGKNDVQLARMQAQAQRDERSLMGGEK